MKPRGDDSMKPVARVDSGRNDLFRSRLDQIVDMNHALAKLARQVDWGFLEKVFGAVYKDGPGHPPLPTRLMAGLAILKHTNNLSDERLCEAWVENPYYQLFCGEEFFRHELPFDRSSITRWRKRMGEDKLAALIQESLNIATRTGAAKPADFTRIIVDTTVQEKAVMFPTDAKLMHRAREKLVRLAKRQGVTLRQSYARVGKIALIMHQRFAHAKQFKRANWALRSIRTWLGRVRRDILRRIRGDAGKEAAFARLLSLAHAVQHQRQRERGKKIYSLHAPEVECIGKGKAHKPYRRQGLARHHAQTFGRRPVHRPRQGAAGQSLRWPHARSGHPRHRAPDRRNHRPHRRRQGLPRPQRRAPIQVQGLYQRPEARRHRRHQTRPQAALGGRAGHRPRQGRPPYGTQLSQRIGRRRQQRRACRRRLQLQKAPGLAEGIFASTAGKAAAAVPAARTNNRMISAAEIGFVHGRLAIDASRRTATTPLSGMKHILIDDTRPPALSSSPIGV